MFYLNIDSSGSQWYQLIKFADTRYTNGVADTVNKLANYEKGSLRRAKGENGNRMPVGAVQNRNVIPGTKLFASHLQIRRSSLSLVSLN